MWLSYFVFSTFIETLVRLRNFRHCKSSKQNSVLGAFFEIDLGQTWKFNVSVRIRKRQAKFQQSNAKCDTIFYGVQCTLFYIENDAEIFPAHYTWTVAEKGFKMAFMMNKLAMIKSCEIILEK